ncbi:MAG: hypothetical protein DRN95_07140 [Candidatus Hydrothermarchaeota archaeon]|nr:MAG: hypothetical protein DRN95_07140 [Candidatus Hydrothermarchaeota archaeon]
MKHEEENWIQVKCTVCGNKFYIREEELVKDIPIYKCSRCDNYRRVEILESSFFFGMSKSLIERILVFIMSVFGLLYAYALYRVANFGKIPYFCAAIAGISLFLIYCAIFDRL